MDNEKSSWVVNNNEDRIMSNKRRKASTRQKIKLVVVGDGGSGKTSLLVVYTNGEFPEDYTPTVFENYTTEVHLNGKKHALMLFDTAGQEDYDRLRPLSYDQVDIVIICYDVTSPTSFENVQIRWIPETKHFCPEAPIILVACKTDLRHDTQPDDETHSNVSNFSDKPITSTNAISTLEGERLSKTIKASAFIECSAKKNENINEIFSTAVEQLFKIYTDEDSCSCCLVS